MKIEDGICETITRLPAAMTRGDQARIKQFRT